MKKLIVSLAMILLLTIGLAGCGSKGESNQETSSDLEYVKDNGKIIIGITEYEPMNYYDESGELVGFDTEFAQAVCKELGVEPNFQVISWDMKETELKAKNIDCIWNGLTVTEDRKENMDFTKSYLINKQCIVVHKDNASKFSSLDAFAEMSLAAEKGSAGETAIKDTAGLSDAYLTQAQSQAKALTELASGNVDGIVIDYTMAKASVGTGAYENMVILEYDLTDEEYAIGFRVGSDLTEEVNKIIEKFISDGTLAGIAEKYDVTELYESAVSE